MKKKKVFLISFNQLTPNFWEQHLKLENTKLFHWKTPEHAINNLTTVWPDIIIIDGYFAKESYKACLREVLRLKSNQKIFCLTPLSKTKARGKTVFMDERLCVSKLDEKVINEINAAINPIQEIIQLKQIA
jgi:orotidine-5'-phosphate decarboxylase